MQNKNTIHYNDVVGIVKLSLKRRGLQLQLVVMETCFGVVVCGKVVLSSKWRQK